MKFSRRRFLGVVAAGSAGLIAPRTFAEVRLSDQPLLLPRAMSALQTHASSIGQRDVIGIVDFNAPSRSARFHLIDIGNGRVIGEHLVAHGRGSDPGNSGWVEKLSNRPGSNASCQGSFLTGDIYHGKHGRSRRLAGLDAGNSFAAERGIVIHEANYVDDSLALTQGRIGRSQGCFAVSRSDIDEVLARLGPERLLFAWKAEGA